jgi:hypothetical protein
MLATLDGKCISCQGGGWAGDLRDSVQGADTGILWRRTEKAAAPSIRPERLETPESRKPALQAGFSNSRARFVSRYDARIVERVVPGAWLLP